MNKAVDYLGNELKVGDKVLCTQLHYRNFQIGTIVKITEYMLQIEPHEGRRIFKQDHYQVINLNAIKNNITNKDILKFVNGESND